MDERAKLSQKYYCPLPFYFDSDESISRALDLSVRGQVYLELDINDESYCHALADDASDAGKCKLS